MYTLDVQDAEQDHHKSCLVIRSGVGWQFIHSRTALFFHYLNANSKMRRYYEPYDNEENDPCTQGKEDDCRNKATHILTQMEGGEIKVLGMACEIHAEEYNDDGPPTKEDIEDARGDMILDEERGK